MKYRLLGRTGAYVSEIGLGAMTFGGAADPIYHVLGGLAQPDVDRVVATALDAGVNFIDTADAYSNGESEELLGHALKTRRPDVVLATKLHARTGPGPNDVGTSRIHVMNALENSLRRLQTDHVDLYQIHNFDHVTPIEETLGALDQAVQQGKVRYVGASNLAAWQVSKALGVSARRHFASFVSVQAHYSLLGRDAEEDLLPMALDEGVGLIVWGPLAGGFLTGKVERDGTIGDQGSRRVQPGYQNFPPIDDLERAHDIVDVVRTVAGRHQATPAQVALAWLLARPGVTSVIVGARRPEQVTDNIVAAQLALTAEDLADLTAISQNRIAYPRWIQQAFAPARYPLISA
jgi:aryl-alcohol dehydrogenase-like predicted oxidoreductase